MGRSVIISTPMPTVEELGKRLGISKRRQAALLRMLRESRPGRSLVVESQQVVVIDSGASDRW